MSRLSLFRFLRWLRCSVFEIRYLRQLHASELAVCELNNAASIDLERPRRIERPRIECAGPLLRRELGELRQRLSVTPTSLSRAGSAAGDGEVLEAAGQRLGARRRRGRGGAASRAAPCSLRPPPGRSSGRRGAAGSPSATPWVRPKRAVSGLAQACAAPSIDCSIATPAKCAPSCIIARASMSVGCSEHALEAVGRAAARPGARTCPTAASGASSRRSRRHARSRRSRPPR